MLSAVFAIACGSSTGDSNARAITGSVDSSVLSASQIASGEYEVWATLNGQYLKKGTLSSPAGSEDSIYTVDGLLDGTTYTISLVRVSGSTKVAVLQTVVQASSSTGTLAKAGREKVRRKRQMNVATTYVAQRYTATNASVTSIIASIFGSSTSVSLDNLVMEKGALTNASGTGISFADPVARAAVSQLTVATAVSVAMTSTDLASNATKIKDFITAVSSATTLTTLVTQSKDYLSPLVKTAVAGSSAASFSTVLAAVDKYTAAALSSGGSISTTIANMSVRTLSVAALAVETMTATVTGASVPTTYTTTLASASGISSTTLQTQSSSLVGTVGSAAGLTTTQISTVQAAIVPPVAKATTRNVSGNKSFNVNTFKAKDPLAAYRTTVKPARSKGRMAAKPSSVNWGSEVETPRNQGSTGSCSAWAASYYKTWQETKEEGWKADDKRFSPMFIFSMAARNFKNFNEASPYSSDLAAEILKAYGCPLDSELPYKDYEFGANPNPENDAKEISSYATHSISDAVMASARNYKAGDKFTDFMYYDETAKKWKMKFDAFKNAVTEGPVIVGIAGFEGPKSSTPEENFFYPATSATGHGAGHAILCIGYDDSKFGSGAWLFRNSWGTDSGEKGDTWLKYTDQEALINSAMTIKDLPNLNRTKPVASTIDAPTGVVASTNAGSVVVTWTKVASASGYKVYRSALSPIKYTFAGKTDTNRFEDFPAAGDYLYLVAALNAKAESKFFPNDGVDRAYVAKGTAAAPSTVLAAPTLDVITSSGNSATLGVTCGTNAETTHALQLLISGNATGPWVSLGYMKVASPIVARWGDRSEFVGGKPVLKVSLESTEGAASPFSNIVECAEVVCPVNPVTKALRPVLSGIVYTTLDSAGLTLSWTASSNVEYYKVFAKDMTGDGLGDWSDVDSTTSSSYTVDAVPGGESYKFAVKAVNAGYESDFIESDTVSLPAESGENAVIVSGFSVDSTTDIDYTNHTATLRNIALSNVGASSLNTADLNLALMVYTIDTTTEAGEIVVTTAYSTSDLSSLLPNGIVSGNTETFNLSITYSTEYDDLNSIDYWEVRVWQDGMGGSYSAFYNEDQPWSYDSTVRSALATTYAVSETYDDDGDGMADTIDLSNSADSSNTVETPVDTSEPPAVVDVAPPVDTTTTDTTTTDATTTDTTTTTDSSTSSETSTP